MRKSLLSLTVLSALSVPTLSFAEDAAPATAEPTSPHTFAYNIGLYSQYIFRGLTQTNEDPAIQGGVDYTHSSGFYAGAWASNISWLKDVGAYDSSSLELDLYGGYANTIGETGVGYNVGLLQYIYPGDEVAGQKKAETTEFYGSLSYKWLAAKLSVIASDGAFGLKNADGSWYAELNGNFPILETGITANLHLGRQEFKGQGTSDLDYTDWKIGATKSWSNGVNVGAYYTDTTTKDSAYTILNKNIGDSAFTVFVQKTF
ncbi:MAG: TorF family putative porin [Methylotenera sp.]|nr:TorF family putative porin [Methylotenera sp.]